MNSICDVSLTEIYERVAQIYFNDTYTGPVGEIMTEQKSTKPITLSGDLNCTKLWHGFIHNCLSHSNHFINNLSYDLIRSCLHDHGLNQLGSLIVLRRRMQDFLKRIRDVQHVGYGELNLTKLYDNSNSRLVLGSKKENILNSDNSLNKKTPFNSIIPLSKPINLKPDTFYSHFLIIDLEATCDDLLSSDFRITKNPPTPVYPHEIIEFPILLYDTRKCKCVSIFHAYCRPLVNPILSKFCQNLTQIEQKHVDQSKPFSQVLKSIEHWLFNVHNLSNARCAIVCDCNADMSKFMRIQCQIAKISFPKWATCWINLSKSFRLFYKISSNKMNLDIMLKLLNLEFVGQQHRGLDDAWNIMRVLRILHIDGCQLRVNERLCLNNPPKYVGSVSKHMAETAFGLMGSKLKIGFGRPMNMSGRRSNESSGSTDSNCSTNSTENRYNPLDHLDENQKQSFLWLANVRNLRRSK